MAKTAVRNVESNAPKSNAVAIPDEAARLIVGLVEKTGLRKETVLRRVLEVGLETLHRNIDDPLSPNATPFQEPARARKPADPGEELDERLRATRKAAKEAKAEKWRVRNEEIDIALTDRRDKDSMDVFSALTPANGRWILRMMDATLELHGLGAGDGQSGFMLDWAFPPEAFKSKRALWRAMNDRMKCDKCRGGDFMAARATTLAVYFGEGFKGDFKKSRLLAVAAESYRNAEICHQEQMAQEPAPAA